MEATPGPNRTGQVTHCTSLRTSGTDLLHVLSLYPLLLRAHSCCTSVQRFSELHITCRLHGHAKFLLCYGTAFHLVRVCRLCCQVAINSSLRALSSPIFCFRQPCVVSHLTLSAPALPFWTGWSAISSCRTMFLACMAVMLCIAKRAPDPRKHDYTCVHSSQTCVYAKLAYQPLSQQGNPASAWVHVFDDIVRWQALMQFPHSCSGIVPSGCRVLFSGISLAVSTSETTVRSATARNLPWRCITCRLPCWRT